MSRIISTTRGLVPNVRRVPRLLVVSTALAAALGVAGQAVPAQAWVEAARGRQPGAMTLSAAPIGCTSNHYIAVPRGSTVSVGVSPATGSNLVADAYAHVVVSVQRWTGSSWGPSTTYDWPNSTALPGNYYNYGNQTPFTLNGVAIGPFGSGYYQAAFMVYWFRNGGLDGYRVINANGWDYAQSGQIQSYCHW